MAQYRHSGRITSSGMILGIAAGAAAGFVTSIPYAYFTLYVPFIYLNIIATLALGLVAGLCTAIGARKGNLQSPAMYVLIGIAAGAVAEYGNWVFWIFAVSSHEILTFNPLAILSVATHVLAEGTWGMTSGGNVTGWMLLCVWVVEGGIIIGLSAFVALAGLNSHLCCPECETWFTDATKTLHYAVPENLDEVVEQLNDLKFKCLAELETIDAETADTFLSLDLYFCPSCAGFGCCTLSACAMVMKDKKLELESTALVDKLILPTNRLAELLA